MRLRLEDLTWQELDGEVVVLDLEGSSYYQLNGSGALLWRHLAAGADRSALEATLVEEYGLGQERAAADVRDFLSDLAGAQLLVGPF